MTLKNLDHKITNASLEICLVLEDYDQIKKVVDADLQYQKLVNIRDNEQKQPLSTVKAEVGKIRKAKAIYVETNKRLIAAGFTRLAIESGSRTACSLRRKFYSGMSVKEIREEWMAHEITTLNNYFSTD